MRSVTRLITLGFALVLCQAGSASAQYMRITTDNPGDPTRLRATGTTILTITLDTNHDRNGSLQSCNSHTAASCGSATTTQPLDMFSYTLALKAMGGTVTWGTFTAADAAYTDTSPQIQSNVEVEINKARPVGTVTAPGLSTLGSIPVTPASGTPGIDVQIGASGINPFGFGTGFGTDCDGFFFPNTYVVGDPSDPCGNTTGLAGDWFDWDGALAGVIDRPPVLASIANMVVVAGATADQTVCATDPDGDPITFQPPLLPPWGTLTAQPQSGNTRCGVIHLAPPPSTVGTFSGQVTAIANGVSSTRNFTITVNVACNCPPVLNQPFNMSVAEGGTADQTLNGSDADGNPLSFFKVTGPTFLTVTTINATTGNIHLAPSFSDAGTYNATVRASNGTLNNDKSLTITVTNVDRPVSLAPLQNMTMAAGNTADQAFSATDPDADAITFTHTGPTFMTRTDNAQSGTTRTGNIHLAPTSTTSGTFGVSLTAAANGATSTRSFTIFICAGCQNPPTLAQPANMTVNAGATADQTIVATDPDGNPLTFSKASGPAFMTVSTINQGTGSATGSIHLAPLFSDQGTSVATVTASDGQLTDSKSFTITIPGGPNRPPTLAPVANMIVCEGSTADQTITASDPDGDPLTFSKVAGPSYMTVFITNFTTGRIHLAPGFSDAGVASATVRASDGFPGGFSDRSFTITVINACGRPPVLTQPANMTLTEGMTADQMISASDADGDPLTFSKVSGPVFMTVTTTNSAGTGLIHLAPGFADSGTYTGLVSVSDGAFTDGKSFSITVLSSGNHCPTANAGGPYSGVAGVPINFNGTGSSDPDGNPLTYAWDFDASDGIQVDAVGPTVSHAYAVGGVYYVVTLTVTDNGDGDPSQACSDHQGTTAQIAPVCDATVFNGYDTIRLGSGKPFWFAYVQPFEGCYNNSDVVIPSFVMKYAGRQISAVGKTAIGGDKSGDGIQEIKISFSKDDIRTLFTGTGLGNGHNTVTVTLEANLASGAATIRGTTQLDVVNNGSFNVAVSPNPLNPQATLTWTTSKAGFARIDLFDIQGRMVRRIVDESAMSAGEHEAIIDGRDQRGVSLPSGVYFIRGALAEGDFRQTITILK